MHPLHKPGDDKDRDPQLAMLRPPPLPSMSLRARETQSMALKHIFDQQMGGHRGTRSPCLQNQEHDPSFASSSSHSYSFSAADFSLPQAATIPRQINQNKAQLTIFYSGNVNVYDDVPADKAHAIMVLAGDSDCVRSPPTRTVEREKEKATPHVMAASPTTNCNTSTINHITPNGFSSPAATASKSPLSLSVSSTPATSAMPEVKPQTATAVRRPQAGIELPYARKASLARFLEKRKDRAQEKQQMIEEEGEKRECKEGECSLSNGKPETSNPIYSSKKQCIEASSAGISSISDKL